MTNEEILATWNLEEVRSNLATAFEQNSENQLLALIRANSFLLYELYSRKYGIQPPFAEISFGGQHRCDFAWLNDNSDGPEWVLVEVEAPKLNLFTRSGDPSQALNHAIEQVRSWRRYFDHNSQEKRRIFGAVSRFRFILVGGDHDSWQETNAARWRLDYNRNSEIEIRSSAIFQRAVQGLSENPGEYWSFAENPTCLSQSRLTNYWEEYDYIGRWRRLLN